MTEFPSSTPRERAHLLRRFPGLGHTLGRAVAEMADFHHGPAVRAWTDIRPQLPRDPLPSPWVAYVHARLPDGTVLCYPVIPDAHNPRADKLVREDDQPHVFDTFSECEAQANKARDILESQLAPYARLPEVRGAHNPFGSIR